MALSERERQLLDEIEGGLGNENPRLATMLQSLRGPLRTNILIVVACMTGLVVEYAPTRGALDAAAATVNQPSTPARGPVVGTSP